VVLSGRCHTVKGKAAKARGGLAVEVEREKRRGSRGWRGLTMRRRRGGGGGGPTVGTNLTPMGTGGASHVGAGEGEGEAGWWAGPWGGVQLAVGREGMTGGPDFQI
jgi:hypothetical protein